MPDSSIILKDILVFLPSLLLVLGLPGFICLRHRYRKKMLALHHNLELAETRSQKLLKNMQEGVIMLDDDGRILSSNESFCHILGYTKEELINDLIQNHEYQSEFYPDKDILHKQMLDRGYSDLFYRKLIRKSGEIFPIEMRMYIHHEGTVRYTWAVMRDITSQKEMEAEKHVSLGHLVRGIAHELNTPLGIAVTASSFCEGKIADIHKKHQADDETFDFIKAFSTLNTGILSVQTSVRKAASLVQQFKKVGEHEEIGSRRSFLLNHPLQQAVLALQAENRGGFFLDNLVPLDMKIDSFSSAFYQIFYQLLRNVAEHAFDGIGRPEVKILAEFRGDNLVLEIEDNGKGIPEDAPVFDPFYSGSGFGSGPGLGLSVVYNLVCHKLKGEIKIQQREIGTCFILDIPLEIPR